MTDHDSHLTANHEPRITNHEIAISVRNLSKKYRLYDTPHQRLKEALHPFRKKYHRDFWALRDVSFEIKKGDTVGIIGRNGSGKSTLLQIIAGTLTPTVGNVLVTGRVSALLELGAGFNPEFTGRQNVYMNGALIGYSREQIDERFDAISAFADIGDFMDQPVKTYSSGMYVRLAFAVSINVDPDILIVDEALSVGDEAFQRKCFSVIKNIQDQGRTIIFVSHSSSTVVELCKWAILFDQGDLLLSGAPKLVVSKYHKLIYAPAEKVHSVREEIRLSGDGDERGEEKNESPESPTHSVHIQKQRAFFDQDLIPKSTISYVSRGVQISDPRIMTLNSERVNVLVHNDEYIYSYSVNFGRDVCNARFGMLIKTVSGFELGGIVTHPPDKALRFVKKGSIISPQFRFKCLLLPGVYFMNAGVVGTEEGVEVFLHRVVDVIMFRVQPDAGLIGNGIVNFAIDVNVSFLSSTGCD